MYIYKKQSNVVKAGGFIALLIIEIILGFYSFMVSESLLVKFAFFVLTAFIVVLAITKMADGSLNLKRLIKKVKEQNYRSKD